MLVTLYSEDFIGWMQLIYSELFSLADALDESSERSTGKGLKDELYSSSLAYVAGQFEKCTTDITERMQQLEHSSDEFVSVEK